MKTQDVFAVAILVLDKDNKVVIIKDRTKPTPHYWKLPGGRGEPGETIEEAGAREIREETGRNIDISTLKKISRKKKSDHSSFIYFARAISCIDNRTEGNEGEEIRICTTHEFLTITDFFPEHEVARKYLERVILKND